MKSKKVLAFVLSMAMMLPISSMVSNVSNDVINIATASAYECDLDNFNYKINNSIEPINGDPYEYDVTIKGWTDNFGGIDEVTIGSLFTDTTYFHPSVSEPPIWLEKLYYITEVGGFKYDDYITSVTIGEFDGYTNNTFNCRGVVKISDDAFMNCTSLEKVSLPSTIEVIGDCAFENCTSLKNITIPKNVYDIRDCAFRGCTSLESITIDGCIDTENYFTFENCTNLKQIVINGSVPEGFIQNSGLDYCLDENYNYYTNTDVQIYYTDANATETLVAEATALGLKTPILLAEGEKPPTITTAPTETTTPVKTPPDDFETTTETTTVATPPVETEPPKNTIEYDENYDINKDGKVNVIDLVLMKKKVLGI